MSISQNNILNTLKSSAKISNIDSYLEIQHLIEDEVFIKELRNESLLSNYINDSDIVIGNIITLQFTKIHLLRYNIYYDLKTFISKNKYSPKSENNYVLEIEDFFENSSLYTKYSSIVKLISSLKDKASFNFNKNGCDISFITNTKNGFELVYDYTVSDIKSIENYKTILKYCDVLNDNTVNEKEKIYINELVEFLLVSNKPLFSSLLRNFDEYYKRCNDAYRYYLRDFNFNKFKFELDSKFNEYADKIQKVVSDAQSKIIIIPAAFMLALMNFDYQNSFSAKNIITIIGYFVMCIITQVLISNQKLQLITLKEQISNYEHDLNDSDHKSYLYDFHLKTRKSLFNQMEKVVLIQSIMWLILFSLVGSLFYFNNQIDGDYDLIKTYSLLLISFIIFQVFFFPFKFFEVKKRLKKILRRSKSYEVQKN